VLLAVGDKKIPYGKPEGTISCAGKLALDEAVYVMNSAKVERTLGDEIVVW